MEIAAKFALAEPYRNVERKLEEKQLTIDQEIAA
jgi:hypothetical protein